MKYLNAARGYLISAAIICICVRVVFWAIEPIMPYLLGGIIIITVMGVAIFRSTKF